MSNLYDNIKIFDADGSFVSYCGKSRAKWYLKKHLAIEVDGGIQRTTPIKAKDISPAICYDESCAGCSGEPQGKFNILPVSIRSKFSIPMYGTKIPLCGSCNSKLTLGLKSMTESIVGWTQPSGDLNKDAAELLLALGEADCLREYLLAFQIAVSPTGKNWAAYHGAIQNLIEKLEKVNSSPPPSKGV